MTKIKLELELKLKHTFIIMIILLSISSDFIRPKHPLMDMLFNSGTSSFNSRSHKEAAPEHGTPLDLYIRCTIGVTIFRI